MKWCDRCDCSVPLDEWRVLSGAKAVKHVGPMRDGAADEFVEPDENGDIECGFVERIVEKV